MPSYPLKVTLKEDPEFSKIGSFTQHKQPTEEPKNSKLTILLLFLIFLANYQQNLEARKIKDSEIYYLVD